MSCHRLSITHKNRFRVLSLLATDVLRNVICCGRGACPLPHVQPPNCSRRVLGAETPLPLECSCFSPNCSARVPTHRGGIGGDGAKFVERGVALMEPVFPFPRRDSSVDLSLSVGAIRFGRYFPFPTYSEPDDGWGYQWLAELLPAVDYQDHPDDCSREAGDYQRPADNYFRVQLMASPYTPVDCCCC